MKCLSDRAFNLVKDEVDRYYSPTSNTSISQTQNVERIILLARLEALHERSGKSLTPAQLWEEVCDILPQIDRDILYKAGHHHIDAPLVGTSIGVSAISIGTVAMLLASPIHSSTQEISAQGNVSTVPSQLNLSQTTTTAQTSRGHNSTFETARSFGWQASLKGQNPPHSAEHWGETAALWQQAITLLNQIPRYDESYAIAQTKKIEYQDYLQQIQARQLNAQNLATAATPVPQFSKTASAKTQPAQPSLLSRTKTAQTSQISPAQTNSEQTQNTQEDFLTTAKNYGWQAALASQNAPHPVEKWANISRLWQLALQNLNKVEAQHPRYSEAQHIKAQYQQNLATIRQRYRIEQDANQRFESLQAALIELEELQTGASEAKRNQVQAIVNRLNTIPTNTVAYQQAKQLIAITNEQLQAMPPAAPTQLAISTRETN